MSRSVKKTLLIVLCATLAVALALPCLFVQAYAETDFSRRGYSPQTISATEFLSDELGLELSEGEQNYLQSHPVFTIKYNDNIPSNVVEVNFDGTNVTVTPKEYSYTAENGQRVTWLPVAVNGMPLVNGSATVTAESEDFVTVSYTASLTLDKASVNGVLNQYYNAAKTQSDRLKTHVKEVSDYNAYLAELDRYNNVLLPQYEQYLDDYAEWKRKDDVYQAYLKEYAQYNQELDAYINYDPDKALAQYAEEMAHYQQYLLEVDRYNKLYAEYQANLAKPELAKIYWQLSILDYMYSMCENRNLRNAIMGDTVASVLSHKDELKIASGEADAVDKADRATRYLRDLITNYEQCVTDEDKYAFYIKAYNDKNNIKTNFANLLRCLDYFYRVDFIRNFIVSKGKDDAYKILLAQLYEIVNALDNGKVGNYEEHFKYNNPKAAYFDSSYRIGGYTPEQILGDCLIEDKNDAIPIENGVTLLPQKPIAPTEVTEPTPPERPQKPIPPAEKEPSGPAPEVVPQPQLPAKVPTPSPYEPTDDEKALQTSFDNGEIALRKEYSTDYVLDVQTRVTKYFRNADYVTVYFYKSQTDSESYYFAETERGGFVDQPTELPTVSKTGYTCKFDGWVYGDGVAVDWANLRSGSALHLYPKFVEIPNLYDVIWVIDGKEYLQKVAYDSIPQFDGTPTKSPDADGRQYRFKGWDRTVVKMTEQTVRYTAVFEASTLITWIVDGDAATIPVWKGDMPVYPYGTPTKEPNSRYAFHFAGWDKTPVVATTDATYTASFTQTHVLTDASNLPAEITKTDDCYNAKFNYTSDALLDITHLFEIACRNNAAVKFNFNGYMVEFSSSDVYGVVSGEVVYFKLYYPQIGYMEYAYMMSLLDENLMPVDCQATPRVTVTGKFSLTNSRLYRKDGDVLTPTRVVIDVTDADKYVAEFAASPNCRYELHTRYNVYVASSSAELLSIDRSENLIRKTEVTVTVLDIPVGKRFERVYAVDMSGNEIPVDGGKFAMPESDVTLFAVLSDIYYTVTFKSEGVTVSVQTYRYGETVVPPTNPFKASDGENSYRFDGWDKPLSAVTGDAEYNAVFTAVPLEELGGSENTVNYITLMIVVAVGVVVVVALAVTLPIVIVRVRRKKRAVSQIAGKSDGENR